MHHSHKKLLFIFLFAILVTIGWGIYQNTDLFENKQRKNKASETLQIEPPSQQEPLKKNKKTTTSLAKRLDKSEHEEETALTSLKKDLNQKDQANAPPQDQPPNQMNTEKEEERNMSKKKNVSSLPTLSESQPSITQEPPRSPSVTPSSKEPINKNPSPVLREQYTRITEDQENSDHFFDTFLSSPSLIAVTIGAVNSLQMLIASIPDAKYKNPIYVGLFVALLPALMGVSSYGAMNLIYAKHASIVN